ncbi:MAG: FAD:protein FMN transferase [Acutalibacteraceae bacterium]|jgi:thiamine biosynthesis lipoprotein
MRIRRWIAGLTAAALAVCSGCAAPAKPVSRTAAALDTVVTVSLYDPANEALLDGCLEKIAAYERLFSRTVADSDVSRINASGGEWVTVSPDTAALLQAALKTAGDSGGAFDITVAPAMDLWDFTADDPRLPAADALAQAVEHVDYTAIEIDGDRVRLHDPAAAIDLGGAAKGYIADRLGDYLRGQGVKGALIDLGGNVLAVGDKKGTPFSVGVRDPRDENGLAATLAVRDRSVVTSGVYERGFTLNGKRYHHILDPATGWPVDNGLASVTILSDESLTGDLLSTACFVMGEEKAKLWIEQTDGVDALFIRVDGTQSATSGFYK